MCHRESSYSTGPLLFEGSDETHTAGVEEGKWEGHEDRVKEVGGVGKAKGGEKAKANDRRCTTGRIGSVSTRRLGDHREYSG